MDEYKRQESIAQSALTDQLKQLRRMLKETRKKLTQSEGKSIGDKTSSAVKSSLSPALSVLAQVLLRIRTGNDNMIDDFVNSTCSACEL